MVVAVEERQTIQAIDNLVKALEPKCKKLVPQETDLVEPGDQHRLVPPPRLDWLDERVEPSRALVHGLSLAQVNELPVHAYKACLGLDNVVAHEIE